MSKGQLAFNAVGVIGCGLIALFEPSFAWRVATVTLLTLAALLAMLLGYFGMRAGGTEP